MSAKRPGLFLYIAVLLLAAAAALLRPASPEGLFRTDIYGMVPGLPDPAEEEFTRRIAGEAVFLLEGKDMSAVLRKARELRDLVTKDGAVGIRLISPEESASFIFAHRYSYAPPPEIEKEGARALYPRNPLLTLQRSVSRRDKKGSALCREERRLTPFSRLGGLG